MNKAVFLDRDGTINESKDYITKISEIEIFPEATEAIKLLNKRFFVIIVTNQPQVARGLCSKKDVEEINAYVVLELQKRGAKIDAVFYCPHHPDFQKDPCQCRKPNIEMLVEAKESFDLDMKKCYMVGDSTRDIKTGKNAGCKTILVKTGHAGTDGKYDVKPDAICRNILEAANRILDGRV